MTAATIWWLLAGAAVAAELLTGTFFLLMISLGLIAGALSAWSGASLVSQLLCAAVVGGGAVVGWSWVKRGRAKEPGDNLNLDIGETVNITHWNADGTARIKYRGTQWTAIHAPGSAPQTGPHRVTEVIGSRLLVEPLA